MSLDRAARWCLLFVAIGVIGEVPARGGPLMTVELTGVVGAFGNTDPATIRTNSYSGLTSGFPADFYSAGTVTTFATGTPFTMRYTFDLGQIPAAIPSTATFLDPAVPTPTHQSTGALQWASASLSIGGFTLTTEAGPDDAAPVADPTQGEFTFIDGPLAYGNQMSYGPVPTFSAEGFMASSRMISSYSFFTPSELLGYFRSASLSTYLYRSTFAPSPFLPAGFPSAFEWSDSDLPFEAADVGYAFGGLGTTRIRSFLQGPDLFSDADLFVFDLPSGLRILSARATTDVPEPASVVLTGCGLAAVLLRRRRVA